MASTSMETGKELLTLAVREANGVIVEVTVLLHVINVGPAAVLVIARQRVLFQCKMVYIGHKHPDAVLFSKDEI